MNFIRIKDIIFNASNIRTISLEQETLTSKKRLICINDGDAKLSYVYFDDEVEAEDTLEDVLNQLNCDY